MMRLAGNGAAVDIDEALGFHARAAGTEPAVVKAGERSGVLEVMTFAELHVAVRTVAAHLAERYPPGSRLVLGYPSGVGFVPAFLGCLTAGMVAVPVPPPGQSRHHADRLSRIAHDAGVRAVLTDSSGAEDVRGWARQGSPAGAEVATTDSWWCAARIRP